MKTFNNRVAAITGAGSGMGQALAKSLAAEGCHLALADIKQAGLEETAVLCRNYGIRVTTYIVDTSDKEAVYAYAKDTVRDHNEVHMIFNNAGVSLTDTVEHMSYKDFEWLMDINFWGVVHGTKAFLPYLQKAQEAHIINTSSIFGTIAVPSQSAYNASKFAVRGFTYALRMELSDSKVNVSCVQPGGVKTNIARDSRYVASDNSAPTREEFVASFDTIANLTSEQAAEKILKGVKKNKAQILVGKDAQFAAIIERLLPVSYLKIVTRIFGDGLPKPT
ncbi:MAG: short-subunit dehydrogenase [Candidatus Azotimanducaceae bacterium]|jgi:short-subunit dehydrogenase